MAPRAPRTGRQSDNKGCPMASLTKTEKPKPCELHGELAKIGAAWLKRNGFAVVATDLAVLGCRERANSIGFRSQCSAAIESKVSRADFLADRKKPHRGVGGMGLYRFYSCPAGLLAADELPARWALLHADGKRVTEVVRPRRTLSLLRPCKVEENGTNRIRKKHGF